jgi:ferredoxin-NADP reductase
MKLTLRERKQETPDVESFIFSLTEDLIWKPGQFLHYVLHHEPTDDRGSDRWFTIASAPFEKKVMITTRFDATRSSTFKKTLQELKLDEQIEVSDLDGDFVLGDADAKHVFIAGGIGVTPFHSILKEADHTGQKLDVTLLYANRDEHAPYKIEFDEFAVRNPKLRITYFIGERIDEAAIRKAVPDLKTPLFYVSGPEPMVESFGVLLKNMGVPSAQVKQDWFPGYAAE